MAKTVWTEQNIAKAAFMAGQGCTSAQVADAIGSASADAVRKKFCALGVNFESRRGIRRIPIDVADCHFEALAESARKRNTNPNNLARILIQFILRDDMIDAVIDDK